MNCKVRVEDIQDVYCCTPLQRATIAGKRSEAYHFILSFGSSVDIDKFCEALACVVAHNAILRTRIVNVSHQGLVQVVVNEAHQTCRRAEGQVEAYLLESQTSGHRMSLGTHLFRSAFIGRVFIATIHHAVMDYWSMTTMLNVDVPCAYQGHLVPNRPPFKDFAVHCAQIDEDTARSFWAARFNGGSSVFPEVVPGREILASEKPTRKVVLGSQWSNIPSSHWPHYIEAAWALTAAAYLHSDSVAYGLVLSGRSSALNGLEQTLGPTIVEVPIQTIIHRSGTIERLIKDRATSLRQLQSQSAIWYDAGEIAKLNEAARNTSRFKTLLNIRPAVSFVAEDADVKFERMVWLKTGSFPLHLECNIQEDGFMIAPSSDSSALPDSQLQRVLGQFEYVLRKLVSSPSHTKLDELDLCNPDDRSQLAEWSIKAPTPATLEGSKALSALMKPQSCAVLSERSPGIELGLANALSIEGSTNIMPPGLSALWLTNPKNVNELVPVGAIGEIVMEVRDHSVEEPRTSTHPSWAVQREDKQTQFFSTGDLGRFSHEGVMELVGRIDNRVKLRGFTIQLEQLAQAIRESGEVRDCVVCTKIVVGRTQLVAVMSLADPCVLAGQTMQRVAVNMTDTNKRIAAIRARLIKKSSIQVVPDS
ncbi:putative NRPS-like protein biosynthetic cluster [Pestalotiopsis sp. 9143b]|nr:putative NRPS-like protein biosynthetic cluster [Pestalotiopsis sp. 9143b]